MLSSVPDDLPSRAYSISNSYFLLFLLHSANSFSSYISHHVSLSKALLMTLSGKVVGLSSTYRQAVILMLTTLNETDRFSQPISKSSFMLSTSLGN